MYTVLCPRQGVLGADVRAAGGLPAGGRTVQRGAVPAARRRQPWALLRPQRAHPHRLHRHLRVSGF